MILLQNQWVRFFLKQWVIMMTLNTKNGQKKVKFKTPLCDKLDL